jgi:succinate dehydrogenase flavin-adding protein (antitoxin of CptAB toxin-antitoxin module)
VLMRALDQMSESEQDEFDAILEQDKGPEEIFAFLKEKVPTIESIIKEESDAFKNETQEAMAKIEE